MNTMAFRKLSYGVYVISTWDKVRPVGCTANSVMQITSQPATLAVSIHHDNYTNQCIKQDGRFAVSILSESSDPAVIGVFGFQSSREKDKFDGIGRELKHNMPVIKDSSAYMICEVVDTMETQTHTVFLGKVLDADLLKDGEPMTYAYYHKTVKGKSPKNAPAYLPEADAEGAKWICSICGYVYDEEIPLHEQPEDYRCPICRQPKSAFRMKTE